MWTLSFKLTALKSRLERRLRKKPRHPGHPAHWVAAAATPVGTVLTIAIAAAAVHIILPSKQIRITSVTSPIDNTSITSTTQDQSVVVKGAVSDPRITRVFLDVNGLSRPVSVDNGVFESRVPLFPGRNRIRASLDRRGLGLAGTSQTVRLAAALPAFDIWSELTWDGLGDIDLHLVQPDGEECWYSNRTTQAGAMLDYDNTVRDGPEHITMTNAIPGRYEVKVVYYRAAGLPARKVAWSVTLRLRNGRFQQTYSGVLANEGDVQTVCTFSLP